MSFVTPLLLAGAGLIAVPIMLHLIMRQQPKHLVFPALRFIKKREEANRRRLRLRHLLLLLLRCAAIALLALALARPSVQASRLLGDQEAPVAAALVIDTSPRMQYRHENKSRLETAQETALWLLPQLPAESDVAVLDLSNVPPVYAVDLGAAGQRIERLKTTPAAQPLAQVLDEALRLVSENEKTRKEVYVFTDLARSAWSKQASTILQKRLGELKDVGVYIIDVGVLEPRNFALADIRLSNETPSKNEALRISTQLGHVGPEEERAVALYLLNERGEEPQKRDQQVFQSQGADLQPVEFQIAGLPEGSLQGFLRILGEDGLAADDIRYFSVEVKPAARILIATPQPAAANAQALRQALAPEAFQKSRFQCEVIPLEELAAKDLATYAAVCLLDPKPLAAGAWEQLESYVKQGGGLAIWLGPNAQPKEEFNSPASLEILPGRLKLLAANQETHLAPDHLEHPILARFRPLENVPWQAFGVYKFWRFDALRPAANVVIPFAGGDPALVEHALGKGRVLTTSTSVSRDAVPNVNSPQAWNILLADTSNWPYFIVANEMMSYLIGGQRLNYQVGEVAVLRVDDADGAAIFSLKTPQGDTLEQSVNQKEGTLVITSTDAPGNYRLLAGGEEGVRRGFSANLPGEDSQLERASPEELQAIFGETEFRLARSREEIDRDISLGRVGRELYPYLIFLVALVLAAEHVLANRFYRSDRVPVQATRPAPVIAEAATVAAAT